MAAVRNVPRSSAPGLTSPALLLPGRATSAGTSGAADVARTADAAQLSRRTAGSLGAASAAPPTTATMVCCNDIRSKVVQALKPSGPRVTVDTWAASVYTCPYSLPMGRMLLTVAVDKVTAGRNIDALPSKLPGSSPLAGLGERAQATPHGTVEGVRKVSRVLTVDTTGLPAVFGPQGQQRTDLACEIASDVPGCWTGGE